MIALQQTEANLLGGGLLGEVLLEETHELGLLLGSLEATVTELGRGVDELEGDLLQGVPRGLVEEALPQGDNPLLGTHHATLDHNEILENGTVVREATHGGDRLLGKIVLSGGVLVLDGAVSLASGIT